MKERKLLFSVTKNDCEWSYTRGTGAGGQKRNKTSSAVHCMHRPSGAHGYSEASRSQHDNKRDAFVKMAESPEFQRWNRLEAMKRIGLLDDIDRKVDHELIYNTKIEHKDGWSFDYSKSMKVNHAWIEKAVKYGSINGFVADVIRSDKTRSIAEGWQQHRVQELVAELRTLGPATMEYFLNEIRA